MKTHKSLLCFLVIGMILLLTACSNKKNQPMITETEEEIILESSMTCVIKKIDSENHKMVFFNIEDSKEYEFDYGGGLDVKNKYDEIMAVVMVQLGEVAEITYNPNTDWLYSLKISSSAIEFKDISKIKIDKINKKITLGGTAYLYASDILVFSDNEIIGLDEVCDQDLVTACVYNGRVYSIFVQLGHGYVRLENYDTYLGGMLEIGSDVIVQVTEDMLVTVREGTYKLQISQGSYCDYKSIVVEKNQENLVNISELQINPDKIGIISFYVTPSNATIKVDGQTLKDSSDAELTYGKHKVIVQADGYSTYSRIFQVENAYERMEIALVEDSEESTESSSTVSAASTTEATVTTSNGETITDNKIYIDAPLNVKVYLDGEYVGITPLSFTKVTGSHIITLSQTGFATKSYSIQAVNNGDDDRHSFDDLETIVSLIE